VELAREKVLTGSQVVWYLTSLIACNAQEIGIKVVFKMVLKMALKMALKMR
jgi:hypothetical protein